MSILARPSVVFAIVFGCFAVLIPRVFLPLFRSKPSSPSNNVDDHFPRPSPPISRNDHSDSVQNIPGTPPHMRGAHPSMRMHHPGANSRQPASSDQSSSKSIVTLALPMYTVGIGVFFIYTCCKYWSKKDPEECKIKGRVSTKNRRWNGEKRKVKYDILNNDSENEENKEDFYAGLDPEYVEYLKSKKQKALDAEQAMTEEQKQMHYALEEMKKSLSFISSKLVTKENRGTLHGTEIVQLQDRLVSTEAQMCKILAALDAASDKVNDLNKNANKSQKTIINEEKHRRLSPSASESEDSLNDDQNSVPKKEQMSMDVNEDEESSLSSYEQDASNQLDDYDSNTIEKTGRTKVHQRNSSSNSSNSSIEEDQSLPMDEQNRLTRRKHQ